MSIPTLLVCDGGESRQDVLEKMIKAEPGLKYLATVGSANGSKAVEQAIKVGGKLVWIDLEDDFDKAIMLMAEVKQLFPQTAMIASISQASQDVARAAFNQGALDVIQAANGQQQLRDVVGRINGVAPAPEAAPVQQVAPAPQAAPAQQVAPAAGASRWGDLDSIPTPGSAASAPAPAPAPQPPAAAPAPVQATASTASAPAARAQEATGEINVTAMPERANGQADVALAKEQIQAQIHQSPPAPQAEAGGSKWGNLDAIPTPGAATATPAPAPQAAPPAPAPQAAPPAPAPQAAPPAPAPQAAPPAPVPQAAPPAPAPMPQPAPAPAPTLDATGGASKWGDLDAIPTPKAVTEEVEKPAFIPEKPKSDGPPPPMPAPHVKHGDNLRPSPSKAEMYNMPSTPAWMVAVILLVIMACVGYYFMMNKPH